MKKAVPKKKGEFKSQEKRQNTKGKNIKHVKWQVKIVTTNGYTLENQAKR